MSLRSAFTMLVGTLSPTAPRLLSAWVGVAAIGGLMAAATAPGCGCDSGASLQACGDAGAYCVCDAYGCRPATQGTGGLGTGGSLSTGGVQGTGGVQATGGSQGTGGEATCDPEKTTCPCDKKGGCPTGKDCIVGLCINGCSFDYQCAAGMVCDNGACVPGCSTSSPCPTGYTCTNGACQVDQSNPQCGAANPCPSGQICANGLCTTHCTANSQCATGQVCDGATQSCIPDPSSKSPCDSVSCTAPETCGTDGFCHYPCSTLHDCQLIDNRFVACSDGVCKTQEEVSPQCTLTMPCPSGMSCISNHCY